MKTRLLKYIEIIIHIILWAIPILFFETEPDDKYLIVFRTADFDFFYPLYYGTLLNMALFYANAFFILPRLSRSKGITIAVFTCFALYVAITLVESGIDKIVANYKELPPDMNNFGVILLGNSILNLFVLIAAFTYRFATDWKKSEKLKREMNEEKLQAELNFLRSQVNPHFLFNTLNNLFAMARRNNDHETADGIGKLSGLMRYMLYETNVERIALQKEIDYIQNYIELQKMRFRKEDNIEINFNISGNTEIYSISPMLLIPFVENAFKHGISLKQYSFIKINLTVSSGKLIFSVRNSANNLHINKQKENNGLGIDNVKRRLGLLYKNRYKINIMNEKDVHQIELKIDLVG